ncbi:hypothetical protein [Sporosarcina sp. FSL K6-1508]|uniref:hypothetical protein n=1 Tax=Sporosarcina sp. FSL K6-1508 TaxID=2921553 RepID=UPI0030F85ED3
MVLLVTWFVPIIASADALPFNIPTNDQAEIKPVNSDRLLGGIIGDMSGIMAPVYKWGVNFITIVFVVGTIVMILSALFKNGQWQKFGQISMLISFITMLLLRGLPIIILSVRNSSDIDILIQETLSLLGFSAVFLCLISIGVSFLFGFGYRLIEHPEFHRWAKSLRAVSILMVLFAIVIPWLLPIM